jgi:hypothetical protein
MKKASLPVAKNPKPKKKTSVLGNWGYSIEFHRKIVGDRVRNRAFLECFRKLIVPSILRNFLTFRKINRD